MPSPLQPEPEPVGASDARRAVLVDAQELDRMARVRHYVLVRHRHNWELLFKFCLVGGSGLVVNVAAFALLEAAAGSAHAVVLDLPGTEYNVRSYHVWSTAAFFVANASNYLLNRWWTFKSGGTAHWLREYVPFLVMGLAAQVAVLAILTVLLHRDSPLVLESEVLAQAIAVVVVTPLSFLGNKLWTFRRVRGDHRAHLALEDADG
jgi:putative flippase GtrA